MAEITPQLLVIYAVLGIFVGFSAGLLGIGGGILMVPLLAIVYEWQGLPIDQVMHLALGTSMAAIVATSISSLRSHHARGSVMWPVVGRLAPGIVLGTVVTTFFATRSTPQFLSLFFSVFIVVIAIQMFFNAQSKAARELPSGVGLFGAGTLIGSVSAMVSIGGGALTVPFLSWCNTPMRKAIGTSAAVGLPLSLGGTYGYVVYGMEKVVDANYTLGLVYLPAVAMISATSVLFAPVGVWVAHRAPVAVLKKVFSFVLLGLAIKTVLTNFA